MFERSDRRFFRGRDLQEVVAPMQRAIYEQHGLPLMPVASNVLSGRSERASYGLQPKVTVAFEPGPEGFWAHVSMTCDLNSTAIAVAVICYLTCFPVGLVLLYLAYRDITQRQTLMMQSLWAPVHHLMGQPTMSLGPPR